MTSAQVVETSVNVIISSPFQDYTHTHDLTSLTYGVNPGFKTLTLDVFVADETTIHCILAILLDWYRRSHRSWQVHIDVGFVPYSGESRWKDCC